MGTTDDPNDSYISDPQSPYQTNEEIKQARAGRNTGDSWIMVGGKTGKRGKKSGNAG